MDWAPVQSCFEIASRAFSSSGSFGLGGGLDGPESAANARPATSDRAKISQRSEIILMGMSLVVWSRRYIRAMAKLDARPVMVLLAALLTAASPPAFPEPPKTRAEAIAALRNADAATRAEAVVWIASLGQMKDAD